MKLHSRIFGLLLLTLVGLGATSMAFLYQSTRNSSEQDTIDRLLVAQGSFNDTIENQRSFLNTTVETIVKDWALRQAVGQKDIATLESVLRNHSRRINADVALFIDNDGNLLASTQNGGGKLSVEITTLATSSGHDTLQRISAINGKYYQLVLAEVVAPLRVGWVGMGFAIDDNLANRYRQLTSVDISFVIPTQAGMDIVASSLAHDRRIEMQRYAVPATSNAEAIKTENWEDLALFKTLDDSSNSLLGVLVQRSLDEPRAQFRSWWLSLLSIFALITLLALFVAYFFSRSITRPLEQLTSAVDHISKGDYSSTIQFERNDEIGLLAKAFSRMQSAVSVREEEIQYRADHDLLTKLLNRNGLMSRLDAEIKVLEQNQSDSHLVLINFRIQHYQEIVDALGHKWGDKLVQQVATRIQTDTDSLLLAHLNADEFALAFSNETLSGAYSIGDEIHRCFDEHFSIRGIELSLSIAAGISVYPESATNAQRLLRCASVALNVALTQQRAKVIYDPELDQNSIKRLTLMSELPSAIKDGQISLHFQPKLTRTDSGLRVEGVECLVRWIHPELGFISPDDFIILAEKTGYIVELTRWVIDQALLQCRAWQEDNYELRVAVNISALDLTQPDFDKSVADYLQKYQLPVTALTLEVTESAAMQDPEAAVIQLAKLEALGVKLSIDDYGTGYSSLAQIKKLPVHELKIDKSFVMDLNDSDEDKIIVRSTLELGHNIGLAIVAEGVESESILQQLNTWGCDYFQGFHIGRPMSKQDMNQWLNDTSYDIKRRNS